MNMIPIPPKAMDAIKGQLHAFEMKFGRPPGPNDPIFFEPDLDVPTPISAQKIEDQMVTTMAIAGIPAYLIWGHMKTGLIPTEDNRHLMSADAKRDWKRAMREYDRDQPDLAPYIAAAQERLAANAYYDRKM